MDADSKLRTPNFGKFTPGILVNLWITHHSRGLLPFGSTPCRCCCCCCYFPQRVFHPQNAPKTPKKTSQVFSPWLGNSVLRGELDFFFCHCLTSGHVFFLGGLQTFLFFSPPVLKGWDGWDGKLCDWDRWIHRHWRSSWSKVVGVGGCFFFFGRGWARIFSEILLMEEILHHLGCIRPYK